MSILFLAAAALLPSASHPGVVDQDTVFVADTTVCSCQITYKPVVTLSEAEPPSLFVLGLSVARLRDGRYVTTGVGDRQTVALYLRNGQLQRDVGRPGNGPGEFVQPTRVRVGRADSLFIIDVGSRRVSIFSERGDFVRSVGTPQTRIDDLLELPNGQLIAAGSSFSKDGAGFSLHVLDRRNGATRPIGESIPAYDPRSHQADLRRLVSNADDGSFWEGRINQYLLV